MTMIERVARAIAEVAFAETHEGDAASEWDRVVPLARAAIQAMREPTDKMIAQMESAASIGIGRPNDEKAIPRLWGWAIDAALSETSEAPHDE